MAKTIAIKIVIDQADAEKRTTQLTQSISKLTTEQARLNKTLKESNGTNKEAARELNKVKVQLKSNRQELNQLNNLQKANNNSLGGLRAANARLRGDLEKVNVATKQGQLRFRNLSKEIGINQTKINRLDATTKRYFGQVGNYRSALGGLTSGFIGFSAAVFASIRIVKSAISTIIDFEKTFTNVLTLLDEADKKQFGGLLREGSSDIIAEFGFSLEDVNKALFDTISAGVPAGRAIVFLREAAKLAVGGVTDLSTAVDGVTSIVNAYGLAAEDVSKVTSAFFTAQKFGKTTVEELSNEIGKVAPVAKTAGISFQELLSTFAELTKQGISTQESSTAIKSTITALIKPAKEAKDKFDELGISTGISAIRQQGLFNVLKQVADVSKTNTDELTALIPNVRALTGVAALGEEALIDYEKILAQVNLDYGENSSLTAAFNEQIGTQAQNIKTLGGELTSFAIEAGRSGNVVGDLFNGIVDGLKAGIGFLKQGLRVQNAISDNDTERRRKEKEDTNEIIDLTKKELEGKIKFLELFSGSSGKRNNEIIQLREQLALLLAEETRVADEEARIEEQRIAREKAKDEAETEKRLKIETDQLEKQATALGKINDELDRAATLEDKGLESGFGFDEDIGFGADGGLGIDEEEDPLEIFTENENKKQLVLIESEAELFDIRQKADKAELKNIKLQEKQKQTIFTSTFDVLQGLTRGSAALSFAVFGVEKLLSIAKVLKNLATEKAELGVGLGAAIAQAQVKFGLVPGGASVAIAAEKAKYAALGASAGLRAGINIASISAQTVSGLKFADGGVLDGNSHANGGIPFTVNGRGGFEAEGGETIINKRSSAMYRQELSDINYAGGGKKFQEGGIVPVQSQSNLGITQETVRDIVSETVAAVAEIPVTVLENDITATQRKVSVNETQGDL